MSDLETNSGCEAEMVDELMAKGFGDPLPRRPTRDLAN